MSTLYIKITKNGISFALGSLEHWNDSASLQWHPYSTKSTMSIEANLREAFRNTDILDKAYSGVEVMVDSPVVLLPLDDFLPEEAETQYRFLHPDLPKTSVVETCVLPQHQDAALFCVSKDLKTVLGDHFEHYHIVPLMFHIWEHLSQHSQTGHNKKLYCYFHGKQMEVCSFKRNHFLFQNTFEVPDWHDAIFFILGVWQNLGFRSAADDLLLLGDIPAKEAFMNEAKGYIKRITTLSHNPE